MQIQEIQNDWIELFWAMADGVKSEFDNIRATDIMEFWKIFELWEEKIKRETELYKIQAKH